jgi:hypothetical protein
MTPTRRISLALILTAALAHSAAADSPITSPSSKAVDFARFKMPGGDVSQAVGAAYTGKDFTRAEGRKVADALVAYLGSSRASAVGVFDAAQTMDSVLLGMTDARDAKAVNDYFTRELGKAANSGEGQAKAGLAMHKVFRTISRTGKPKTIAAIDGTPEFRYLASHFASSGDAGGDAVMAVLYFGRNEFAGRATARQKARVLHHLTEATGKLLAQNSNGNRGASRYAADLVRETLDYATGFYPTYSATTGQIQALLQDTRTSNAARRGRLARIAAGPRATLAIAGDIAWKAPSRTKVVFGGEAVARARTGRGLTAQKPRTARPRAVRVPRRGR